MFDLLANLTDADADAILAYAFGQSTERPKVTNFSADPDRMRAFTQRFLCRHGVKVVQKPTPTAARERPTQSAFARAVRIRRGIPVKL